jgi:hypothetical protein
VRRALPFAALLVLALAAPARAQDPVAAFDGNGMWIHQVARSERGDPAAIAARAKRAGLSYVVVKAAHGPTWWPQFSRPLVDALHLAGVRVCAYQRALGRVPAREARVLARAARVGADCLVIDAEIEYERKYAQAARYIDALRDVVGDAFPVGLTSFPYIHVHRGFPYSVFLGPRGAQVNLPQLYWKLLGTNTDGVFANSWALNAIYGRPIRPLGQVFGRPGRGALLRFRRVAARHGVSGVSWWVWQHAGPTEWSAVGAPLVTKQQGVAPPAPATLRAGAWGDPVRWLQLKLNDVGELVPITARFDAATAAAVTRFRARRLLSPLPVVDAAAWTELVAGPRAGELAEIVELPPV